MPLNILNRIGEWNPQIFREFKGRWKSRNVIVTLGISAVTQLITLVFFWSQIPFIKQYTSRYCLHPIDFDNKCLQDAGSRVLTESINYELLWLDCFVTIAIGVIAILWILGTYFLIEDISKESNRGTLEFIRLSPQTSWKIIGGKLAGVPSLLFLAVLAALPFHLWTGLAAHIPLNLILSFYLLVALSCLFIYSAALLVGFVTNGWGGTQTWLASGLLAIIFAGFTLFSLGLNNSSDVVIHNALDWFTILLPQRILPFLVSQTPHSLGTIGYLNINDFTLKWFGFSLGQSYGMTYAFISVNYLLGIYWLWQALIRRFHQPNTTLLSKAKSYWFSGGLSLVLLGFTTQQPAWGTMNDHLPKNVGAFCFLIALFSYLLMAVLTPHRQTLQDWVRYRHQQPKEKRGLLRDLVWGEKSPATLAIALNLLIIFSILHLGLVPFFPHLTLNILQASLITSTVILMYASVIQWILLMKSPRRSAWALGTFCGMLLTPILLSFLFGLHYPNEGLLLWSIVSPTIVSDRPLAFTHLLLNVISQTLVIVTVNAEMSRQLRKLGASQTQMLLTAKSAP
ncbi:hypothetical protein K4A83_04150 [Spirulina subsalsa FACHB-351]|uniref:ABC transporter permease n=1 Tax=Spirulina subsalsa FACHB-351 TaxID=234711 RepID=A0ABT3L304_9CYAN|nr:hypothetical protein [Spirulina subsalsa]MCW6035469.1 hypothetical protein [Spirulina subsalsa FACHB-351]